MANKLITAILVILLIFSGLLGFYTFTLSEQVSSLSAQMAAWQQEQTEQLNAVNNELAALKSATEEKLDKLETEIAQTRNQISSLEGKLTDTAGSLYEALSRIDSLEEAAADNAAALSSLALSNVDIPRIYQTVDRATVSITNGNSIIGAGFIFDDDAHVLTANHVIDSLSSIYVVLSDGRISKATLTGRDEYSDIAVLKLDSDAGIEPPPLADSSELAIGETVIAIGNPFELEETLTAGVISQVNRFAEIENGTTSRWIANLIQFDAPVNAGNSGGPLVNAGGEIIGVVIARINPAEGDGINYAISANKIKVVAASLLEKGYFDYPWLGINMTNLTPQTAQTMGLDTVNGMLVTGFSSVSPARSAGMKANDVIIAIDGVALRDSGDLTAYLGEHKSPDEIAVISVLRDNIETEIAVQVGRRPF